MSERICPSCRRVHPQAMDCEMAREEHLRLIEARENARRARKNASQDRWRKKSRQKPSQQGIQS